MLTPEETLLFWDGPLSQWARSSFVDRDGIEYNCCEQYMMYQKAKLFGDQQTAGMIRASGSPKDQKRHGRQIKGFNEATWLSERLGIVWQGNFLRFSQDDSAKRFLLSTGNKHLVEASPYDKIWGAGLSASDPNIYDPTRWPGLNLLGETLMSVRYMIWLREKHLIV